MKCARFAQTLTCYCVALGWILCVSFSVGLSIRTLAAQTQGERASWYAPGWGRRIPITIERPNASVGATDYQVRVEVGRRPEMQERCQDLRFTASDGVSELPFWIASEGPESVLAWVRVPDLPASGKGRVYLYYGNRKASPASNGRRTFEFFDDFSTNTLDFYDRLDHESAKYNDRIVWDAEHGRLHITSDRDSGRELVLRKVRLKDAYVQVDLYGTRGYPEWWYDPNYSTVALSLRRTGGGDCYSAAFGYSAGAYPAIFRKVKGGREPAAKLEKSRPLRLNRWHTIGFGVSGDRLDLFLDGEKLLSCQDPNLTEAGGISVGSFQLDCYLDNLVIAKYVSPAPAVTVGEPETMR